MTSKIEKTLARQKEKIEEGQYYEAHQQLRVLTARYLKQSPPDYTSAISILSSGANLLFKASQGGSGGDLCIYLLEVYNKAELKPDAESKSRVIGLIRAFPQGEPTRKKFIGEVVAWSAKFGEFPAGDPEVHHVAGQLFAEEGEPYDAERYLSLGTKDSPQPLAKLEYTWYTLDTPDTAAYYAARGIFPLLLARNLRGANTFLLLFIRQLGQSQSPAVQEVSSSSSDMRVYPSLPLLNFLSLLLLACQRGSADLFKNLKNHYAAQIKALPENAWDDALESVAEMYFGIRKPRQGNPMMDMFGSMFGGGGGGAAAAGGKGSGPAKKAQPELQAPGLD